MEIKKLSKNEYAGQKFTLHKGGDLCRKQRI